MARTVDVIEQWSRTASPAVIFDFNGTLSDDEPILFDIFSELFATHLGWAMTAEDYHNKLLGMSDREIIEYAVDRHGSSDKPGVEELLKLRHGHYRDRVAGQSPITDPAVALVELLVSHNIPVAIVTGAQRDDVLAVLEHSPVRPWIPILIAEEDVVNGKPHPEGYLTAAGLLERNPADILVFEDSVPGVRAAQAAGMNCVAVSQDPSPQLRALVSTIVTGLSPDLLAGPLARRAR
ncbi:haloacid dehalogenase [Mycobacterium sp. MS1601]|nr:haloacid dehalogenase [Mycobacterium sp. MS1601]